MVAPKDKSEPELRDVRCAKCGHANSPARNSCKQCGSRLYIACRACGSGNIRSNRRCAVCSEPLHRSTFAKLGRRLDRAKFKIPIWQILLLVIIIPVAFKVIIMLTTWGGSGSPAE